MSKNCIFCRIVKSELPAHILWEDEDALLILDAFPVTNGHALFLPKKHYEIIQDLPEQDAGFLSKLPEAAALIQGLCNSDGLNIVQNNDKSAGQVVPHLHFHLIPRFTNDELFHLPASQSLDAEFAQELLKKRDKLFDK